MFGSGLAGATCPIELLHKFTLGTLSYGGPPCNVTADVCTDTTEFSLNYGGSCSSALKIAGKLYSLAYVIILFQKH